MIEELIKSGQFDKASDLIQKDGIAKYFEKIIQAAAFSSDISYYAFVNYLNANDDAHLHYLASQIAATTINHYKGGYTTGYFHIMKAIELAPENVDYKSFALLFNDIPDKLLSNEQAKQYADDILKKEPNSEIAKMVSEK